ncbi:hypothetical protein A1O3_06878 [Capronia epimyces CBS 606.96]|uniref:Hydantoinase/oxoprolinase n=1 Tax=Capronia epimyces CBS 606.96 TaxID=1182542 RepID=W9XUB3_9EURO|nr:uncharacterized protein A1O3_06878 [Capronia epimyces CBS 606.96]EXJ80596.1 hypothetical protein A1O3_06878 [Capronia epimyces CBS 606.96]
MVSQAVAGSARPYRIGVDVGGTNTDAVILDLGQAESSTLGVIATHKAPTSQPNVTDGIETAVRSVLQQSKISVDDVACLIIGTTHFINAVVENDIRRLSKVAVIRLSRSFTRDVPPFADFPPALKESLHGYYGWVDGGLHIDGAQESPINEDQVREQCRLIKAKGIDSIVVSGVYSPIDRHFHQEASVRDIIQRELPDVDVVCSSDVSQIGFLERENASILNASILKFARHTIRGFKLAMKRLNLHCGLYLTQNDGSLIDAEAATRLPIRTFSSGPTNSMRGAAYLGKLELKLAKETGVSTLVLDVGGTTSDIGVLLPSGFPRQSSAYSTVAGVRVNFGMPHVTSIGLGGGSLIHETEERLAIGPTSVGNDLTTQALVFGGSVLTTTDVAVAAVGEDIGDGELVKHLDPRLIQKSLARIKAMVESAVDDMKTSPDPIPLLLVGGGSIIVPDGIRGVSQIIRPRLHSVANAIGAATSKVSGALDSIESTAEQSTAQIVEHAKKRAIEAAISAGAEAGTISIAEVDVIPLQYVANQVRVLVRAVGDLSHNHINLEDTIHDDDTEEEEEGRSETGNQTKSLDLHVDGEQQAFDIDAYRPQVSKNLTTGIHEWIVSERDLAWIADGCYILGCGGGGSPYSEFLRLRAQLRDGHVARIIDAASLPSDARIYWGGYLGSPQVFGERLTGPENRQATEELQKYLGDDHFDAFMTIEIGGACGLLSMLVGSSKNFSVPTIDADWMGRAYPMIWQTTLCVHAPGNLVPCAIASGDGKTLVMTQTTDDEIVDRALRAVSSEMGSLVGLAMKPTTRDHILSYGVRNTLSLAWRIGRCVARAEINNTMVTVADDIIREVGGPESARVLFRGKIVAVERRLHKAHSYGEIVIQQLPAEEEEETGGIGNSRQKRSQALASGGQIRIPFKNENIYAKHEAEDGSEKYLAMVPDLISVLDSRSGRAVGVPEYRYGLLVTVLGITGSTRWTDTPRGLALGGPKAFGYDLEYKPLGVYKEPKSVILEYR